MTSATPDVNADPRLAILLQRAGRLPIDVLARVVADGEEVVRQASRPRFAMPSYPGDGEPPGPPGEHRDLDPWATQR